MPYTLVSDNTATINNNPTISYSHNKVGPWFSLDLFEAIKSHGNFMSLAKSVVFAVSLDTYTVSEIHENYYYYNHVHVCEHNNIETLLGGFKIELKRKLRTVVLNS
jgi:hypothetical protein